jgi:Ca2+:H+ antiporter
MHTNAQTAGYLYFQLHTHSYLFRASDAGGEDGEEKEEAKMSLTAAVIGLLAVTVVTSFCADYLVASIDDFANRFSISKAFIGLILIPIVGCVASVRVRVY